MDQEDNSMAAVFAVSLLPKMHADQCPGMGASHPVQRH
jgi:hypothetical protein